PDDHAPVPRFVLRRDDADRIACRNCKPRPFPLVPTLEVEREALDHRRIDGRLDELERAAAALDFEDGRGLERRVQRPDQIGVALDLGRTNPDLVSHRLGRGRRGTGVPLWRYQPRVSSSSASGRPAAASPLIGSPRPPDTRASTAGSRECVVASTMAFARVDGSADLKIPDPTQTPSPPSCIQSAASAGAANPTSAELT